MNIIKNHIKPKLGFYLLSQITTATMQEFMNATDVVGFIKINPALKVKVPRYDIPGIDQVHIFTNEEVQIILKRFKKNKCVYYAFLTVY